MKRSLSEEDKKILREWGYIEKDIEQIERGISKTQYFLENQTTGEDKKITPEEARNILGTEKFLSGLGRSCFHYNSGRESEDGLYVHFDSSKLLEEEENKIFNVKIKEILSGTFEIEAKSQAEAEHKAIEGFYSGKYLLDPVEPDIEAEVIANTEECTVENDLEEEEDEL